MSATECNQPIFEFSRSDKRKVRVDFRGGDVTSNGGLVLIAEIEKKLRLSKQIAGMLPDHRDPERMTHTQESMVQ